MSDFNKPDKIPIEGVGIDEEFHGKFPTDAFEFTESSATVPTITVKSAWKLIGDGGVAPIGSIIMFGGATAPTGYVLCNNASLLRAGTYADLFAVIGTTFGSADGTHFNVPDMRGIFPRGAGVNGTLSDAGATGFTGVLGTYQNDSFQGHKHTHNGLNFYRNFYPSTDGGYDGAPGGADNYLDVNYKVTVGVPITDSSNGTPRTGTETNPANLGITYIIKI